MSSLLLSLPELFNSYKSWVSKNPQTASDYETTAKWLSYFVAGRIHNSHTVSELVYCLSNLLVLFNDSIIKNEELWSKTKVKQLKLWLAVIEYAEVFCELSAQKLWGNTGKWLVIVSIQIFKCIGRLLLIFKHGEVTIETPAIPPLDRTKMSINDNGDLVNSTNLTQSELGNFSFTLKRSGRVVRKVDSSPPLGLRTWKPLEIQVQSTTNEQYVKGALVKRQLIAEAIYIIKPIVHLVSVAFFGSKVWKPWTISLAMDIISLQLYKSTQKSAVLTKNQQLQLSKRTMLLLLYLIRSPFYEKHSKNKINAFLVALSNNIPFIKIICHPLLQYLPFWQSSYFYMWSS